MILTILSFVGTLSFKPSRSQYKYKYVLMQVCIFCAHCSTDKAVMAKTRTPTNRKIPTSDWAIPLHQGNGR